MDRPPLIVLEVFLGFVAPIAWAVWELAALRRDRGRREREARAAADQRPSDAASIHVDRQA